MGGMFICSTLVDRLECQDLVEGMFCGYHSLAFLGYVPLPNNPMHVVSTEDVMLHCVSLSKV